MAAQNVVDLVPSEQTRHATECNFVITIRANDIKMFEDRFVIFGSIHASKQWDITDRKTMSHVESETWIYM